MNPRILSVKVYCDICLALQRDRSVVDPIAVGVIDLDVSTLSAEDLKRVAHSIDPDGSGQMNQLYYSEDGVFRDETRVLRVWPLTSQGIVEALGRNREWREVG